MKHKTLKTIGEEQLKAEKKMKYVAIDRRTTIMVAANIPDEEARERFRLRVEDNHRKFDTQKVAKRWTE